MKNISAATSSSLNTSTGDVPSKVKGIIWCGVFAMESIFIVVGNLLTIVLFASSRKLRKKSLLIAINMAFADAMIGIVCLPLHIYVNIGNSYQLWTSDSYLTFFGTTFEITQTVFSQASLISSALISGERFFAIYWPLKHQILPVRAYYVVISIIWALSIIVTTVFITVRLLISRKYAFYTLMSCYMILLFIVCFCNSGIWRKFRLTSNIFQQHNRGTKNRRLTTTLLFVSIVALLSWFPMIIIFQVSPINIGYAHYFAFALCYFSFFVNPVVYALRFPEFRQALVLCFSRRKLKLHKQGHCREKTYNRVATLTPVTRPRAFSPEPSHLQLEFKETIIWKPRENDLLLMETEL